MNLAQRLAATDGLRGGPRCRLCILLMDLREPDAGTLRDAVAGNVYSSAQIATALKAEGHAVSAATVARHRRQECRGVV